MAMKKTALATLAALGAQIIFGFSFMFTKIALGYASPLTVIADRYLTAFVGLSIVSQIRFILLLLIIFHMKFLFLH